MRPPPSPDELIQALTPVVEALEALRVPYCIVGSVASSVYGRSRATRDVDVITGLDRAHVQRFVAYLQHDYYVDEEMIWDAIRHAMAFNVISLATQVKVDVFPLAASPHALEEAQRALPATLTAGSRPFLLAAPEDVILAKLDWWRMGGEDLTSIQWADVVAMITAQQLVLDLVYLRQAAPGYGVSDLLEQALTDAGL